jgi:hypothetical protein
LIILLREDHHKHWGLTEGEWIFPQMNKKVVCYTKPVDSKLSLKRIKMKLQLISAHGALASMIDGNEALAKAMVDAVLAIDPSLILVARPGQSS